MASTGIRRRKWEWGLEGLSPALAARVKPNVEAVEKLREGCFEQLK